MKPNEVTDERFFLNGNRGAIFANHEAHIARKGHHPETLCGIPMLYTNYYPGNEHIVTSVCSHCEDEYKQATGTKKTPMTMKERIRLYLPIVAALYEVDSQELDRTSLNHILQYLLKGTHEEIESFLEDMVSISEDDPEAEAIAWVEEYLLQDENHSTINKD